MLSFIHTMTKKSYLYFALAVFAATALMTGCGGMNGTYIAPPPGPFGLCSLIINNGYDYDIAVKLADVKNPNVTLHYVYVSAKSTAVIEKIAPGNLMMRYTQGKEWDPVSKMFQRDRANFESDQIFKFEEMETETKTSDGIVKEKRYSVQSFTLNPSMGEGNTTTSQIDDKEFGNK
ncbi:MAG: hypothetical protein J0M05_08810 [Candidatus Kapabacteria bacterium]|nr:hypothetical protein [Candidatus Kapabacteria bacterium]